MTRLYITNGDEYLFNEINNALEELKADGSIDAIVNKYIPA